MCEKEKLLLASNFFFSHNVFHSYISLVRQNVASCGDGLKHNCIESLRCETIKRRLYESAKRIDSFRPAQSAQADLDRTFLVFINFLHTEGLVFHTIQTIVLQNRFSYLSRGCIK